MRDELSPDHQRILAEVYRFRQVLEDDAGESLHFHFMRDDVHQVQDELMAFRQSDGESMRIYMSDLGTGQVDPEASLVVDDADFNDKRDDTNEIIYSQEAQAWQVIPNAIEE